MNWFWTELIIKQNKSTINTQNKHMEAKWQQRHTKTEASVLTRCSKGEPTENQRRTGVIWIQNERTEETRKVLYRWTERRVEHWHVLRSVPSCSVYSSVEQQELSHLPHEELHILAYRRRCCVVNKSGSGAEPCGTPLLMNGWIFPLSTSCWIWNCEASF